MVGATQPSLRNGLTAYSALSPGTGLSCPRRRAKTGFAQLGTSVGLPGPHGFAVHGRLLQGHATGLVRSATALAKAGQHRSSCDTAASIASHTPRP